MARRTFKTLTLAERFWPNVERGDGCWRWTKGKSGNYGRICLRREGRSFSRSAHRVSWELHYGPIPDGLWVLHKCDNPICVRPDHLYLGTVVENTRDMMERGRNVLPVSPRLVGEAHPSAVLVETQIREMRALFASGGLTFVELGAIFGVSEGNVRSVCKRRTWRHVA